MNLNFMKNGYKWRYIIIFIVAFLLGYATGYAKGAADMLNWSVEKALYFLKLKGIELDIDAELITHGIMQYKQNIAACYPQLNISEMPI